MDKGIVNKRSNLSHFTLFVTHLMQQLSYLPIAHILSFLPKRDQISCSLLSKFLRDHHSSFCCILVKHGERVLEGFIQEHPILVRITDLLEIDLLPPIGYPVRETREKDIISGKEKVRYNPLAIYKYTLLFINEL